MKKSLVLIILFASLFVFAAPVMAIYSRERELPSCVNCGMKTVVITRNNLCARCASRIILTPDRDKGRGAPEEVEAPSSKNTCRICHRKRHDINSDNLCPKCARDKSHQKH